MVGATLAELPGSIRLLFFSLAGDREKKASCSPVFVLAHAVPTGACGVSLELLGRFELPQRIALKRYSL